jgi:hypothetical protein
VKSFLHFKANGQTCKTWWDVHHTFAELIVPKPQVELAFACTTDFSDIKDILLAVVSSSELGDKMFGRAYGACKASDVGKLIQASMDKIKLANITKLVVDTERANFAKDCNDMGKDPNANFDKPKMVKISYRGVETPVVAKTFLQEWTCHVEAFIRTVAVDLLLVSPLWCENELVPMPRPPFLFTVEKQLYQDTGMARKALSDLLDIGNASGESIRNLLKSKQSLSRQFGRQFKIEESVFENMVGEYAEKRLMAATLACLPAAPK